MTQQQHISPRHYSDSTTFAPRHPSRLGQPSQQQASLASGPLDKQFPFDPNHRPSRGTVSMPTSPMRRGVNDDDFWPGDHSPQSTRDPFHPVANDIPDQARLSDPFDAAPYTAMTLPGGSGIETASATTSSPWFDMYPSIDPGSSSDGGFQLSTDEHSAVEAEEKPSTRYPTLPPGTRKKRAQVRIACTHCQKACKKCSNTRPCERCVKYGLKDCVDSSRKPRKSGVKRGPYKRRRSSSKLNDCDSPGSSIDAYFNNNSANPFPTHTNLGPHAPPPPHHLPPPPRSGVSYIDPMLTRMHPNAPPHAQMRGPPSPAYAPAPGGPVHAPHQAPHHSQVGDPPSDFHFPPGPRTAAAIHGAFASALHGPRWNNGLRSDPNGDAVAVVPQQVLYPPTPTAPFPISLSGTGREDPFSRAVSPIHGTSDFGLGLKTSAQGAVGGGGFVPGPTGLPHTIPPQLTQTPEHLRQDPPLDLTHSAAPPPAGGADPALQLLDTTNMEQIKGLGTLSEPISALPPGAGDPSQMDLNVSSSPFAIGTAATRFPLSGHSISAPTSPRNTTLDLDLDFKTGPGQAQSQGIGVGSERSGQKSKSARPGIPRASSTEPVIPSSHRLYNLLPDDLTIPNFGTESPLSSAPAPPGSSSVPDGMSGVSMSVSGGAIPGAPAAADPGLRGMTGVGVIPQSPGVVALTKIRKPSLRTLMGYGGSQAGSRQVSPIQESPTLFNQPMSLDDEDDCLSQIDDLPLPLPRNRPVPPVQPGHSAHVWPGTMAVHPSASTANGPKSAGVSGAVAGAGTGSGPGPGPGTGGSGGWGAFGTGRSAGFGSGEDPRGGGRGRRSSAVSPVSPIQGLMGGDATGLRLDLGDVAFRST